MNSGGTYAAQSGFTGAITHIALSGVYSLTLAVVPVDSDLLAIEVTQASAVGGEATISFVSPGVVTVNTFNSAGVATDRAFMVTVFDLN